MVCCGEGRWLGEKAGCEGAQEERREERVDHRAEGGGWMPGGGKGRPLRLDVSSQVPKCVSKKRVVFRVLLGKAKGEEENPSLSRTRE